MTTHPETVSVVPVRPETVSIDAHAATRCLFATPQAANVPFLAVDWASGADTLLQKVVAAQRLSAALLDSRNIADSADHLINYLRSINVCWLASATSMGNRLVGAALARSNGLLNATDDGSVPQGESVAVIDAVVVRATALQEHGDVLLALGARSVWPVALHVLECDRAAQSLLSADLVGEVLKFYDRQTAGLRLVGSRSLTFSFDGA